MFLPFGGAINVPTEFEEIGSEGARLGYHTIVLAYRNEVAIAAPPDAGAGADPLTATPAGLRAQTRAWRSSTGQGTSRRPAST